jgi:hypothetical protein
VNHDAIGVVANFDLGIRRSVKQLAVGLIGDGVERTSHEATFPGCYFLGMTAGAGMALRGQGEAKKNAETCGRAKYQR